MCNIINSASRKYLISSQGHLLGTLEGSSISEFEKFYPQNTFLKSNKLDMMRLKHNSQLLLVSKMTYNRTLQKIYHQGLEFLKPIEKVISQEPSRVFDADEVTALAAYIYDRGTNDRSKLRQDPKHIRRFTSNVRYDTVYRWSRAIHIISNFKK